MSSTSIREMTEKGSRYIDFLIPGLLGMNLLGTGVWGVGFYIVTVRMNNLLKRLIAAPMKKSHFLAAQVLGRLVFLVPEVGALLVVAYFLFDVPIRGSLATLALVSVLGAMTFCGFGLLTGSRAKTIEGASGIMNFIMLPMWILSGAMFPPQGLHPAIGTIVKLNPLTYGMAALRRAFYGGSLPEGTAVAASTPALELGVLFLSAVAAVAAACFAASRRAYAR